MATSPKRVNLQPASALRQLLLNIPMAGGGTVVENSVSRGRTWTRRHRRQGALHPLDDGDGYACGNFALTGGTEGAFDDLGTEHSVPISWIIDPFARNPYRIYQNHNGIDPGRLARIQEGNEHRWKGRYHFSSPDNTADDQAPLLNFIPNLMGDNSLMPNNYSLSGSEWSTLQSLWRSACEGELKWKKTMYENDDDVVVTNDAETTSEWGDRLRSLNNHQALNDAEKLILRNQGPLHNRAAMKFFHKMMKRVAELYGWKLQKYRNAPSGTSNGVGIAVTSCSWWAADHWGFVVTNAQNPNGTTMPYAFFQQVPTCDGELDCYGTRLWDEGRAITVLWVDQVPQLVLDKIRDHYY